MDELLASCLLDLELRIDEGEEQANRAAWVSFAEGRCADGIFTAPAREPKPPRIAWPAISCNGGFASPQAMLLQQLGECSRALADGGAGRLCIRCNYGTPTLPSLFGCELFLMEDALNTLPACHPLGQERMKAIVECGVPNLRGGLGGRVFDSAEFFIETLSRHPVLQRNIAIYHPDVQGPMDVAEMVWGSDIFLAFYDDAPLLRQVLELVTQTYAAFMREWYKLVPAQPLSTHWGLMHRGTLMLREDSLMNLSPEIYADFIRPLDQRLFDEFGGGAIHFCGRGDHFIEPMSQMRGLSAINLSQPHLNDMDRIYRFTVDKGMLLLGFDRAAAEKAGRPLRGAVHCW